MGKWSNLTYAYFSNVLVQPPTSYVFGIMPLLWKVSRPDQGSLVTAIGFLVPHVSNNISRMEKTCRSFFTKETSIKESTIHWLVYKYTIVPWIRHGKRLIRTFFLFLRNQLMINWWKPGPGGLYFWDPLMKGIVTIRHTLIESQTTGPPDHQLTISWFIIKLCSVFEYGRPWKNSRNTFPGN